VDHVGPTYGAKDGDHDRVEEIDEPHVVSGSKDDRAKLCSYLAGLEVSRKAFPGVDCVLDGGVVRLDAGGHLEHRAQNDGVRDDLNHDDRRDEHARPDEAIAEASLLPRLAK
jgi:hypothetical protein